MAWLQVDGLEQHLAGKGGQRELLQDNTVEVQAETVQALEKFKVNNYLENFVYLISLKVIETVKPVHQKNCLQMK